MLESAIVGKFQLDFTHQAKSHAVQLHDVS